MNRSILMYVSRVCSSARGRWHISKEVTQNTSEAKYQKNSKQLVDPVFRTNQLSANNNNSNNNNSKSSRNDSFWDVVVLSSWSVFCVRWSLWPRLPSRVSPWRLPSQRTAMIQRGIRSVRDQCQLLMMMMVVCPRCRRRRQSPEKKNWAHPRIPSTTRRRRRAVLEFFVFFLPARSLVVSFPPAPNFWTGISNPEEV